MNLQRSANPVLGNNTFTRFRTLAGAETMTIQGTVNKVFLMLLLVVAGAAYTWNRMDPENPAATNLYMILGGIGGFIAALVTVFKVNWSPFTAPIYAVLQGLFLGGISAMLNAQFPGIVINAVALTFGTLFALLFAYKSGLIKATENFRLGVVAATGGIFFTYLISFVLGLFGVNVGFIHSNGTFGIIFSLVVVVVAALNLVLDFDFIEKGAESGAPKFMEWYGAFGLMVTLIWLYIEFLRLLSKLSSRN
jgi:uncharacterized YccA/Bax inhibitor family protein